MIVFFGHDRCSLLLKKISIFLSVRSLKKLWSDVSKTRVSLFIFIKPQIKWSFDFSIITFTMLLLCISAIIGGGIWYSLRFSPAIIAHLEDTLSERTKLLTQLQNIDMTHSMREPRAFAQNSEGFSFVSSNLTVRVENNEKASAHVGAVEARVYRDESGKMHLVLNFNLLRGGRAIGLIEGELILKDVRLSELWSSFVRYKNLRPTHIDLVTSRLEGVYTAFFKTKEHQEKIADLIIQRF